MSKPEISPTSGTEHRRLTMEEARSIDSPTETILVRLSDGKTVEALTLLRYAGHYRTDDAEAFAIKNASGKFQVRGATELGLTPDSNYCLVAVA